MYVIELLAKYMWACVGVCERGGRCMQYIFQH